MEYGTVMCCFSWILRGSLRGYMNMTRGLPCRELSDRFEYDGRYRVGMYGMNLECREYCIVPDISDRARRIDIVVACTPQLLVLAHWVVGSDFAVK